MNQARRPPAGRPRRPRRALLLTAAAVLTVAVVVTVVAVRLLARPDQARMSVELVGDRLSLSSPLGSSTLRLEAVLHNPASNGGFNLIRTLLDGAVIHRTSDDVAPIRTSLGTVGGNHGFARVAAFANPDQKTTADLGSVWTDGSRDYVLLAIDGTGRLVMGGDYERVDGVVGSRPVRPRRELTQVSGAVHRGPVVGPGSPTQLHPSTGRVQVGVTCDGGALVAGAQQCTEVRLRESYEVLDYAALYDAARTHVGTSYASLPVQGAVRVQNDYTFSAGGVTRLRSEVVALEPTTLAETGLLQSAPLTGGDGRTVIRQVPDVKPIEGFDFRRGVDLGGYHSDLRVASGDLVHPGQPPTFALDRIVESGRTLVGFSLGYVPTGNQAGSRAARTATAAADYWDLRGTGKSYPVLTTGRRLEQGDRLTVEAFRTYLGAAQADQVAAEVSAGTAQPCPSDAVC